ncbi:unnamed protein product [Agarophyton chilense]
MLSQRRSSEQASQSIHSTPSQMRLESALRHATVLFSTTAFQENDARPESPAPSQPISRISEASAVRRIFSREPRRRPVHSRLAVAANAKNPHIIRVYHLVDYGVNTRPLIHRSWNISDLRKVDGLGQPVSESVSFALHFIPAKVFIFRTLSPKARASFLWSLLQTCVSRLKRAPPVQHLRLLDLQTMAEESPVVDDGTAMNQRTSEISHKSVNASERQSDVPPTHTSEASTKRHSSHTIQSKRTSLDESKNGLSGLEQSAESNARLADVQTQNGGLGSQARRFQKFPRAFSEPKLSDSTQKRSETTLHDGSSQEAPRSEHVQGKDSYLEQLAFEAAAKRFGNNRSLAAICGTAEISNLDSDPKALWFDNRRRPNEANTRRLMEQMHLRRPRKQTKLKDDEKADLLYSLELFAENTEGHLHEFGEWLESHIQKLEVENIRDIVEVESCEPCLETTACGASTDGIEREDLHDVLIKSITAVGPWLRKCESQLEPYARLSQETNDYLMLLETQHENTRALQEQLDALLHSISFTDREQALVDYLDGVLAANEEFDYSELLKVILMLSWKSREISKLNELSGMDAVTNAQRLISEKRNRTSRSLLPILKSCLEDMYAERERAVLACHEDGFDSNRPSYNEDRVEKLRKGLLCLAACESNAFSQVMDHYVELSSSWTTSFLRFAMQSEPPISPEKNALNDRMIRFAESLLYGCLVESQLAFSLFYNDLRDKEITMPTLLRRQLPSPEFLREFLKRAGLHEDDFEAGLHQHFWRSLEFFSKGLTCSSSQYLEEVVFRVQQRLRGLYDVYKKQFPTEVLRVGIMRLNNEAIIEALDSFQSKCRVLCSTSQRLVETHANAVLTMLSEPLDLRTYTQRSGFFLRVKRAVDLASELSGVSNESAPDVQTRISGDDFSRSICEKLIGATLHRAEEIPAVTNDCVEDLKLQCYGYVSGRIGEPPGEEYLIRLTRLADRIREPIMGRWINRTILGKMFNELFQDATSGSPESYVKMRTWVASLNPSVAASEIRGVVRSSLEEAAKTCAIIPFYDNLISLIKERVDEILRKNRRNKNFSEVRPLFCSFIADLLSMLRIERESLQKLYR